MLAITAEFWRLLEKQRSSVKRCKQRRHGQYFAFEDRLDANRHTHGWSSGGWWIMSILYDSSFRGHIPLNTSIVARICLGTKFSSQSGGQSRQPYISKQKIVSPQKMEIE